MREAVTRSITSAAARPAVLLVGGHVAQFGNLLQFGDELRGPYVQFVQVRIFQRVLILRAAHAVFHRQILHRLHVQRDAIHFFQFRLQAADHFGGVDVALFERFQVDQNASAVERGVGAINADEGGKAVHGGIFQDDGAELLLLLRPSAGNEMDSVASEMP